MVHLTPFLACKTEPHPCKFDLDHINTRASKKVSAQNLGGGTFHGRLNVPGVGITRLRALELGVYTNSGQDRTAGQERKKYLCHKYANC